MAAAPPPPRRLIRQNAVVQENFELPPLPQMQALERQQALALPNNVRLGEKPLPVAKSPYRNLPRTEKERKRLRSSRRRRISTRRRHA